jgi:F-type H+-transporting ATPase subunit epsilon
MTQLKLDITTPEALISSTEVDMVTIPGEEGDFAVLAEHAPLISTIRPGAIEVYSGNEVIKRYFVTGGFVEVNQSGCNILATRIEDITKLTRDEAEKRVKKIEKAIRHPEDEFELARNQEELKLAETLLGLVA